MIKKCLISAAVIYCAACYNVVPLSLDVTPARGATVIADLNNRGSDSLAAQIGPGIMSLRGDILSVDERQMTLAMRLVTDRRGVETFWTKEPVVVQRSFVEQIKERRFSRMKSVLMGVGLTTSLFILTDAVTGFAGVFGSSRRPGTPSGT